MTLSAFNKSLDKQLKTIDKKVDEQFKLLVLEVFNTIVIQSPVYSGYYASNHSVALDTQGFDALSPPVRPTNVQPGQFFGQIAINQGAQQEKMSALKPTTVRVKIGTNVPYADIIEQRTGVYRNAAAVATANFGGK